MFDIEVSRSTITSITVTIISTPMLYMFSTFLYYTIGEVIESIKNKEDMFKIGLLLFAVAGLLIIILLLLCSILTTWNIFKITVI